MEKTSDNKTEKGNVQEGFEESLAKLEKIVSIMEQGRLPLEEMLKQFEEANNLASFCSAKLKEIERRIEILVGKDADTSEWKAFDEERPRS